MKILAWTVVAIMAGFAWLIVESQPQQTSYQEKESWARQDYLDAQTELAKEQADYWRQKRLNEEAGQ